MHVDGLRHCARMHTHACMHAHPHSHPHIDTRASTHELTQHARTQGPGGLPPGVIRYNSSREAIANVSKGLGSAGSAASAGSGSGLPPGEEEGGLPKRNRNRICLKKEKTRGQGPTCHQVMRLQVKAFSSTPDENERKCLKETTSALGKSAGSSLPLRRGLDIESVWHRAAWWDSY